MLAVLLALGAAATYGTGMALQHEAASTGVRTDAASVRLLARLPRRAGWVVGLCLSGLAFILHVAALHWGPLTVVQPLVVTATVFAVLVRSGLDHTLPDKAEVLWCACTCVGLTVFLGTVGNRPPRLVGDERTAALFLVGGALTAAVAVAVAVRTRQARRGFFLGVAAGIFYGCTAGLVKLATSHARLGLVPLLSHWTAWVVLPIGLTAFCLSQWAYSSTRLSVSAPVLNIVDVAVAVAFGVVVFSDHLFDSPGQLGLELLGAVMTATGVWQLVQESERVHERQALAAALEEHQGSDPEADRQVR